MQINEKTTIPLKVLLVVLPTVVGATWMLSAQVAGVNARLSEVNSKLSTLTEKIGDAWSVGNMQLWAERMEARNPGLKVPRVNEVMRDMRDARGRMLNMEKTAESAAQ